MGGIFGSALSALQGFFTRGFWFGAFLPVICFAALNLLIAHFALGWVNDLTTNVLAEKWSWSAPIAAALIVLAYAMAPLVPLCRKLLEGRDLPDFLFNGLRAEPLQAYRRADAALSQATERQTSLEWLSRQAPVILNAARQNGIAGAMPAQPALIDQANITAVRLQRRISSGKATPIASFQAVIDSTAAALEGNSADQNPALNTLTAQALNMFQQPIRDAGFEVGRRRQFLKSLAGDRDDIQPTTIGTARNLSELYSRAVYRVEFEFLWPRVQTIIPDNDPVVKQIEAARALIDFAVLSLLLTLVLLAVWLPLLAMWDTTPWAFLALGLAGPAVVRFLYQLVVESQISLGKLAQVVVDNFRQAVLTKLHIKPPATLIAEREIWSTLADIARGDAPDTDFVWTAPK